MEVDQSTYLMDLPDEILEKIVDYLPFVAVRQNLRLTCKRLHRLCNSEYFCQKEVFVCPKCEKCWRRMIAALANSTRGCYNLILQSLSLEKKAVTVFFRQHGAKVRSLLFKDCNYPPGLFQSIIKYCEGLVSITTDSKHWEGRNWTSSLDSVVRPSVTSLTLELNYQSIRNQLHISNRIPSAFPCLKHLDIEFDKYCETQVMYLPAVLNFVLNFSNLESLNLEISNDEFLAKAPQFPRLKELHLLFRFYWHHKIEMGIDRALALLRNTWPTFISRLNGSRISSITKRKVSEFYAWEIAAMLSLNDLESLILDAFGRIEINLDIFKALISSQLKKMEFRGTLIAPWASTAEYFPAEVNKTVTHLTVFRYRKTPSDEFPLMVMFPTYFHGLVHLETDIVNDAILQRIFKYQINLRSLILGNCGDCSVAGFFGWDNGPGTVSLEPKNKKQKIVGSEDVQFENSITNLQKLEHLLIKEDINDEIIQSQQFQTEFTFPQLKYLNIRSASSSRNTTSCPKFETPVDMLKTCVNLESVALEGFIAPSSAVLSSLFQSLKYLNYMRIKPSIDRKVTDCRSYVNLKQHYWIDSMKLLSSSFPDEVYYDDDLGRTVFTHTGGKNVCINKPKIGSYTVDWICILLS